jgi:hypothetical protein
MRFAAPVSLIFAAVPALLAGCKAPDDPAPASGDVPTAGSAGVVGGGAGGLGGAGGASGAGTGAAGSAGASAAGIGGAAGAAGTSGAGAGGSMSPTAGVSGGPSAIPADFATVKLVLGGGGGIMPCAAAPCHGVGGVAPPAKPLELPPMDDLQLYANLTSYVSAACNQTKLVEPGNPTQSALLMILRGPCGMTPRMPYGCDPQAGDCIPDEYIAAVEQWIASGAPPP